MRLGIVWLVTVLSVASGASIHGSLEPLARQRTS